MTEAQATSSVEEIMDEARAERDRVEAELREITSKLEQSRGELERLAKGSAKVTGELKNLEKDFESVPRATIKEVYEAAQDAQQRLYVMRGQVEKFQADQVNLSRYLKTLDQLLHFVTAGPLDGDGESNGEVSTKNMNIRIIEAAEDERKRLAKQMHDGPAQSLTNFILQAEICQRLFDKDQARAREELTNLKSSASSTFQKVRDFIFDLRPMMLDDLGLLPTARRYVEAFKEKGTMDVQLLTSGEDRRLEAYREVIVFRALQTLLGQVRDDGSATEVTVSLDMGTEQIRASVEDNGRGFGTGDLEIKSGTEKSVDLGTIQERVALIGGEVHIDSTTGQGSKVVLLIPAGPRVD